MASQTIKGKTFKYALLFEFYERLKTITSVSVSKNKPYKTAKGFFDSFSESEQDTFRITASSSINFLIDIESRLSNGVSKDDTLVLELVSDHWTNWRCTRCFNDSFSTKMGDRNFRKKQP